MNPARLPRVSIITVTLDCEQEIEETLRSVVNQSYPNLEYIVIDGGSRDDTVNIIRRYENKIDFWVSEPDNGIYDAMNKGIDLCSGEWINLMNAGDRFYCDKSVEQVVSSLNGAPDLIFGDVEVRHQGVTRICKAGEPRNLSRGMVFSHQTLFVKKAVYRQMKYERGFGTASDFAFIYRALKQGFQFINCERVVVSISAAGISDRSRLHSLRNTEKAVLRYESNPKLRLYYFALKMIAAGSILIKQVLPNSAAGALTKAKYAVAGRINKNTLSSGSTQG